MFGSPIIDSFRGEYHFLSNFYLAPVYIWGITFVSSEHAYQWAKTHDPKEKETVLFKFGIPTTPGQAKRAGAVVTKRDDWEEVRYGVMVEIQRAKFTQNPNLKTLLLATDNAVLIEGNTWCDNTWGACTCEKCVTQRKLNLLGAALMQVRTELA